MQINHTKSIGIFLASITLALPLPALAEDDKSFRMSEDRIQLSVGGYFPKLDSQMRISNDQNQGTLIDLEDDFGLDDSVSSVRIEGHYRFNPKHRFIYSFIDVSRNGSNLIERGIIFDDKVYTTGSLVTSDFQMQIIRLLYGYSFFQNNNTELSFSTGIVGLDIDTTIDSPLVARETDDSFLPFPVVGLRGMHAYNRELMMRLDIDFFKIEEGDFEAEVIDWNLAIEYNIFKRVDLGLAYGSLSLVGEKVDDNDKFDFDIEGFFVYSKFGF
jgi:hypothetical protein